MGELVISTNEGAEMSVLIKRSVSSIGVAECPYGCCTPIYGKSTKRMRRLIKRSEQNKVRKFTKNPDAW